MDEGLKHPFSRLSLSQQFLLASAAILLLGMLVIGVWLQHEIKSGVVNRTAALAAVYVESIVAANLRSDPAAGLADPGTRDELDRLFVTGPLSRKVVRVKLWSTDGTVLYSSDRNQVGLKFPLSSGLTAALSGEVQGHLSTLNDPDNVAERRQWEQLIEVYVPIHAAQSQQVVAVAEFYHATDSLFRDVSAAQRRSWVLIVTTTLGTFLLLWGTVRRVSQTLLSQRRDLREQLHRLQASLDENEKMRQQLRDAGERTTALNEQFLQRIAADIHDGPAQDIALALLRVDALTEETGLESPTEDGPKDDVQIIRDALHSSLDDLRAIARGLGNPGVAPLSLSDTVRRVVRNFSRKSGKEVDLTVPADLADVSLAVKITAYRVLQESLTNAWLHGGGVGLQASVATRNNALLVTVTDGGQGFDATKEGRGRMGLAFMSERVRLLGGSIEIESALGRGTRVCAIIPLK